MGKYNNRIQEVHSRMVNRRKLFIPFLICLFFIAGCQQTINHFQERLHAIETSVQQSKWKKAAKELNQMQTTYEKHYQWKDFYIRPEEYTMLTEQVGLLQGAINEKDSKEASIQLSAIKSMVKRIYYQ